MSTEKLAGQIEKWQRELDGLQISDRWGETRRFQSNTRKLERREWLIDHLSTARVKLQDLVK